MLRRCGLAFHTATCDRELLEKGDSREAPPTHSENGWWGRAYAVLVPTTRVVSAVGSTFARCATIRPTTARRSSTDSGCRLLSDAVRVIIGWVAVNGVYVAPT